ncbi:hypothetical protein AWM75_08035 [Aerococcus urinaehominis]|uniref:Uncharacterized protein n=1 Tax=Aerococcus urinaehominis TaxID=128944 RepID=A0A0X8FMB8_9LACT|nr:LysR family transcriptional regulator [Aerococcus urinaehominis]AMB99920.1 hypothetical protein AWM75_08035 [Aerococcus urinaehominis]SDM43408.1 DNA-binding transcriptional regulator, LysR family [Aerococcus urinaehominis]
MNLDQLFYIVEIAQTRSLTQAARNIHVSQAGLSQSLAQLEDELQVTIFKRTVKGSELTPEGERIVDQARQVLAAVADLKAEAASINSNQPLLFKMGVANELMAQFATEIQIFQDQHPHFQLSLAEGLTDQIVSEVRAGNLDLGFIVVNRQRYDQLLDLQFKAVMPAQFKVYMASDHPLAKQDQLSATDLKQVKLAVFTDEYIEDFIADFTNQHGPLNVVLRTTAFKLVYDYMVNQGAVSIIRDSQFHNKLHQDQGSQIVGRDLQTADRHQFMLGWLYRDDRHFNHLERAFIQAMTASLQVD